MGKEFDMGGFNADNASTPSGKHSLTDVIPGGFWDGESLTVKT